MRTKRSWISLLIAGFFLAFGLRAHAAVDMFLKSSPAIEGESLDASHPKEIEVLAWSWGMSNPVPTGGGAGKVHVQDLSITKYLDKASPVLMLATCTGQHYDSMVLTVRKATSTGKVDFLKVTMTQVSVTSVSTGGSTGEDRLTENITLSFATVKVDYTPILANGTPGTVVSFGWDIAGNQPLP